MPTPAANSWWAGNPAGARPGTPGTAPTGASIASTCSKSRRASASQWVPRKCWVLPARTGSSNRTRNHDETDFSYLLVGVIDLVVDAEQHPRGRAAEGNAHVLEFAPGERVTPKDLCGCHCRWPGVSNDV